MWTSQSLRLLRKTCRCDQQYNATHSPRGCPSTYGRFYHLCRPSPTSCQEAPAGRRQRCSQIAGFWDHGTRSKEGKIKAEEERSGNEHGGDEGKNSAWS